ncbi:uncharacterized protein LOC62_03G003889 [Vanrija pseudolonga]|uniref:F-box domain-containing protein n=1 Tax=Vanrija pseudolonga TaxID=143232 RepID=A0AAF0Y9R5_9TREE|nr:hypothetical protein LOC62_03G003889 [Vanrija pseudolonga]
MLDANAFPHLVDTVLSHCTRPTLLTLRLVSRSLRDSADGALAAHVVLYAPDRTAPEYIDILTREGRHPAFLLARVYSPFGEHTTCSEAFHRTVTILERTRTVDLVGDMDLDSLNAIASALSVDLVRTRPGEDGAPPPLGIVHAPRLISFTSFTSQSPCVPPVLVPDGTSTFTLHIRYAIADAGHAHAHLGPIKLASSVSTVAVIFSPQTRTTAGPLPIADLRPAIDTLVLCVAAHLPEVQFTFVGCDGLSLFHHPLKRPLSVESAIRNGVHIKLSAQGLNNWQCVGAMYQLRFCTVAQWQAMRDPVDFALEMEE